MECLYCGDCCLRMSPISSPESCPFIVCDDDFVFCRCYSNRPHSCERHEFPTRFCPIGIEKLKLKTAQQIGQRIDTGWAKIKNTGNKNMKEE